MKSSSARPFDPRGLTTGIGLGVVHLGALCAFIPGTFSWSAVVVMLVLTWGGSRYAWLSPVLMAMAGASVAIAPSGGLNPGNQSISGQREDANGSAIDDLNAYAVCKDGYCTGFVADSGEL